MNRNATVLPASVSTDGGSEVATLSLRAPAGSSPRVSRPVVLYAAGDGDLLNTFQFWKANKDDPSQVSVTYSGQYFDTCKRLGWDGVVLSRFERTGKERSIGFLIDQRPMLRFRGGPAVMYHLEQVWSALCIIVAAIQYRASVVIVASGASHWFPLAILRLAGVKVVPSLHCVLWPKYIKPSRIARMVYWLDGVFFARAASAVMTTSSDVEDQIIELAGSKGKAGRLNLIPFLPSYRRGHFAMSTQPPEGLPLRLIYAGRIEPEKGVFDLLEMARRLHEAGRADFQFEICGIGSALDELRRQIDTEGLAARIRCPGHCDRATMVALFERSHVVIVPTTSRFVEGFNQVVAESVIIGRPVVTSSVCPAIRYLGDAVIAVPPDDVDGYVAAIERLATDKAFYEHTRSACADVREQFFDDRRSWGAAVERGLRMSRPKWFASCSQSAEAVN